MILFHRRLLHVTAILGIAVIGCYGPRGPVSAPPGVTDARSDLCIATAQPLVVPGDIEGNIDRMTPLVVEAARRGARVVVTSEAGICGYDLEGVGAAAALPIDSPVLARIATLARDNDIVIVAGLYERDGDAVYNSAVAFYPDGRRVVQRKHNVVGNETQFARRGDRARVLFDVHGFTCGILICADTGIEGIYEDLARDGCDVVLMPVAGGGRESIALHQSDVETPEARGTYAEEIANCISADAIRQAMEYDMAMVSCNQSGWVPAMGFYHGGCSWIIDRTGRIAAIIPYRKILEHVSPDLAVGTVSRRTGRGRVSPSTGNDSRASRTTMAAEEPSWKVGVATVDITPTTPVWLAGYSGIREPDGTLHRLWAKAIAFEAADGGRAVLVTSDFQGVPASMSDRVFARLASQYGLDRSRAMFTFSHNHCSPRLGDDLVDYYPVDVAQEAIVARYTEECVDKCVALVGKALAAVAPATVRIGVGRAGFAVNRRDNKEAEVPDMIAKGAPLRGATDHDVPVLTITRPDGRLEAVLFGYACHPTVLNFEKYCGDYPGFAQLAIERSHPGTTALFVNTCGADQNPLPRRTVGLCERYGLMLAAGVEETLRQPMQPVDPRLRTAFELVDLDYEKIADEAALHDAAERGNEVMKRWAGRMLAKRTAGETFAAAYPYPLHAWRLGDQMLVIGMGGETVVDYGVRFKRQWGPSTWVLGYTDDMAAYIPSRRVWEEGGYEGGSFLYEYGRPAFRWAGHIEDTIANGVQRLVDQVNR